MIAAILPMVLRGWPYLAGATLVLVAILWFRHQLHEAGEAGYKRATAEFAEQLRVSAEEGREAVQNAIDQAQDANQRQRAQYEARYAQAREQHEAAVSEAAHRLEDWQRRYQRAQSTDLSCQRWSAESVRCPLE
jgi:hypothetical protein